MNTEGQSCLVGGIKTNLVKENNKKCGERKGWVTTYILYRGGQRGPC
jgi:hypothetical protein